MSKKGIEFIVNEQKNTVVCLIKNSEYGTFRGIAKKDSIDTWDEEFGKKLAKERAVLSFRKFKRRLVNEKISHFEMYAKMVSQKISNLNKVYDSYTFKIEDKKLDIRDLLESLDNETIFEELNHAAQQ